MSGYTGGEGGVVELLRNAVRPYAWGSRTAIAELVGGPVPAPHPQAETVARCAPGRPIGAIARRRALQTSLLDGSPGRSGSPPRYLPVHSAGGSRLPFLLKVLAAEEPLSLQAHPSAQQAAEGFAREEARGNPADARTNYSRSQAQTRADLCAHRAPGAGRFPGTVRTVELLKHWTCRSWALPPDARGRAQCRRVANPVHHLDHDARASDKAVLPLPWMPALRYCAATACAEATSRQSVG